jgi:hypothetical protein
VDREPEISAYLQRVSWLLRQGNPANDVAVYLPTADAFASFTAGGRVSVNQSIDRLIGPAVIPQILDAGYNFDFIDDGAIAKLGVKHRVLILPGVERIPLATLEKITKSGAAVLATRRAPSLAPGLQEQEPDTPPIRELARGLKLIADESKLGDAIKEVIPPDLASVPEIGFVHRKTADAEIYFIANTSNQRVRTTPRFRVSGLQAAEWDPFTGESRAAKPELDLAPYESRVVVFSKLPPPAPAKAVSSAPVDLGSGWKVTFRDGSVAMPSLRSWTEDEARRFYSGQATYERTLTIPSTAGRLYLTFGEGAPVAIEERRSGAGMRAMMDGPVRDAAVVYVNGKRAGAVWCSPYEIDVTAFVKPGENTLRIVAGNSALNAMAKGPLPDYKALTAKYGERFQAQDMQAVVPQPSGLLGPVRLAVR